MSYEDYRAGYLAGYTIGYGDGVRRMEPDDRPLTERLSGEGKGEVRSPGGETPEASEN